MEKYKIKIYKPSDKSWVEKETLVGATLLNTIDSLFKTIDRDKISFTQLWNPDLGSVIYNVVENIDGVQTKTHTIEIKPIAQK